MPVVVIGLLATAAIGGGGYYAWKKTHPSANGTAEGAGAAAGPGWRQRLASVRGGSVTEGEATEEAAASGGRDNKKDDKKKGKKKWGMPKMPKVKIPTANEVKVMVAKQQMGL